MAVFKRSNIENGVEVETIAEGTAVENIDGHMNIKWPGAGRVVASGIEFVIFTAIAGFCCWGVSYAVTSAVSAVLAIG